MSSNLHTPPVWACCLCPQSSWNPRRFQLLEGGREWSLFLFTRLLTCPRARSVSLPPSAFHGPVALSQDALRTACNILSRETANLICWTQSHAAWFSLRILEHGESSVIIYVIQILRNKCQIMCLTTPQAQGIKQHTRKPGSGRPVQGAFASICSLLF